MEEAIQSVPSFDLLDEPWIMVELLGGTTEKLGLLELFERASEIRRIVGEMPQMQIATIRLCEAILYRCFPVPGLTETDSRKIWTDLWQSWCIPEEVYRSYLLANRQGFNLFGDLPFYQVADLAYESADPSPISALMPDVPRSDKTLFTMRSVKHADTLSFDEAARYLLLAQGYDASGIKTPVAGNTHVNKGKVYPPKGLPGTCWCGSIGGTYLEGRNLFETLVLNLVLFDDMNAAGSLLGIEGDIPPWERKVRTPDLVLREPAGPVDLLTWQNRRIRLVPDDSGERVSGVILCYGDVAKPIDKQGIEMMTPWRASEVQQKKWSLPYVPWMPKKHDPSKSIWRGLSSLIAYDEPGDGSGSDMRPGVVRWINSMCEDKKGLLGDGYSLTIHAQGMEYGTQDSVFTDSVNDSVSLCAMLLRHDAEAQREMLDVISAAEESVGYLASFVRNMFVAQGDHRRYGSLGDAAASAVMQDYRERAYAELDGMFRERIAHFTPEEDPVKYGAAWRRDIHRTIIRLAEDFLEQSDVSCFSGGEWGAGRSFNVLCARLTKQLGPLVERSLDPSDK